MRVDEIVDQVVGRSWLQGCPNICAATHFHARSSSRANVVLDVVVVVSFAVCRFFIWNSQMCWHCHCWSKDSSTHTEGCGIPHLHKRGRKNRGYSSGTAVWHICHAKWNCSHTLLLLYTICAMLYRMYYVFPSLEWPEICVSRDPKSLIRFIKLEYSLDLCRCVCCVVKHTSIRNVLL